MSFSEVAFSDLSSLGDIGDVDVDFETIESMVNSVFPNHPMSREATVALLQDLGIHDGDLPQDSHWPTYLFDTLRLRILDDGNEFGFVHYSAVHGIAAFLDLSVLSDESRELRVGLLRAQRNSVIFDRENRPPSNDDAVLFDVGKRAVVTHDMAVRGSVLMWRGAVATGARQRDLIATFALGTPAPVRRLVDVYDVYTQLMAHRNDDVMLWSTLRCEHVCAVAMRLLFARPRFFTCLGWKDAYTTRPIFSDVDVDIPEDIDVRFLSEWSGLPTTRWAKPYFHAFTRNAFFDEFRPMIAAIMARLPQTAVADNIRQVRVQQLRASLGLYDEFRGRTIEMARVLTRIRRSPLPDLDFQDAVTLLNMFDVGEPQTILGPDDGSRSYMLDVVVLMKQNHVSIKTWDSKQHFPTLCRYPKSCRLAFSETNPKTCTFAPGHLFDDMQVLIDEEDVLAGPIPVYRLERVVKFTEHADEAASPNDTLNELFDHLILRDVLCASVGDFDKYVMRGPPLITQTPMVPWVDHLATRTGDLRDLLRNLGSFDALPRSQYHVERGFATKVRDTTTYINIRPSHILQPNDSPRMMSMDAYGAVIASHVHSIDALHNASVQYLAIVTEKCKGQARGGLGSELVFSHHATLMGYVQKIHDTVTQHLRYASPEVLKRNLEVYALSRGVLLDAAASMLVQNINHVTRIGQEAAAKTTSTRIHEKATQIAQLTAAVQTRIVSECMYRQETAFFDIANAYESIDLVRLLFVIPIIPVDQRATWQGARVKTDPTSYPRVVVGLKNALHNRTSEMWAKAERGDFYNRRFIPERSYMFYNYPNKGGPAVQMVVYPTSTLAPLRSVAETIVSNHDRSYFMGVADKRVVAANAAVRQMRLSPACEYRTWDPSGYMQIPDTEDVAWTYGNGQKWPALTVPRGVDNNPLRLYETAEPFMSSASRQFRAANPPLAVNDAQIRVQRTMWRNRVRLAVHTHGTDNAMDIALCIALQNDALCTPPRAAHVFTVPQN